MPCTSELHGDRVQPTRSSSATRSADRRGCRRSGARDPACARVRRLDDRRRRPLTARPRPCTARGDVPARLGSRRRRRRTEAQRRTSGRSLIRAIDGSKGVELEYLKPGGSEVETRTVEPYKIERDSPHWYVQYLGQWTATLRAATGSTARARPRCCARAWSPGATASTRRCCRIDDAGSQLFFAPAVARWKVEKGRTRAQRRPRSADTRVAAPTGSSEVCWPTAATRSATARPAQARGRSCHRAERESRG